MTSFLLHTVMGRLTKPLDEFSQQELVAFEIPPLRAQGFEKDFRIVVNNVHALGPQIACIVQPSFRQKTQKSLWVHKWNQMEEPPFRFCQTCSCKLGNGAPGCHFTMYIGTTLDFSPEPCSEVPSQSGTPESLMKSMVGTLTTMVSFRGREPHGTPVTDTGLYRAPADAFQPASGSRSRGLQWTPDSLLHTSDSHNNSSAFPTDAKEREKAWKKAEKEAGREVTVKKKKKIVEDHYDDCGDNMSSLDAYADYDTDEELLDEDYDQQLLNYYQDVGRMSEVLAYPINEANVAKAKPGVAVSGRDHRAVAQKESKCPGCRFMRARNDWTHTREIGQCSYPHDEPFIPKCEACIGRRRQDHEDHTLVPGECKALEFTDRKKHTRKRRSDEPHEVRVPESSDPTAHTPITGMDGKMIGEDAERKVQAADDANPPDTGGSSGSGNQPPPPPPAPAAAPAGEGQMPEANRQGRGPDTEPRVRRTFEDAGTGPENAADWSNFDIGSVVRVFRTNRPAAIRLALRKLHTRWWHAPSTIMTNILKRVCVPQQVLDLIPSICDTCKVCRQWQKRGPHGSASLELPDKFNQQVEADLLFMYKYIIFHLLDRSSRWHAGCLMASKEEDECLKALGTAWITHHGAMNELITDGESGIVRSEKFRKEMGRLGIKLHPRGKDQHAWFIERRGALLRDQVHRMKAQLSEEGIDLPFELILAEAIFAGNALLSFNGTTPYNAVYGRVPNILPGMNEIRPPGDSSKDDPKLRHTSRLREVSVQAILDASARARLGRALNTRSTMPAQRLNLQVGEEVDFYRDQANKDTPGWFGPATVADVSRATRGVVTVRWRTQPLEVQLSDIRRHLHFMTFLSVYLGSNMPQSNAWNHLYEGVSKLTQGAHIMLGKIYHNGQWTMSSNSSKHIGMMSAIKFFGENSLHLKDVIAARIGVGLRHLPAAKGYASAVIVSWIPGMHQYDTVEQPTVSGNNIMQFRMQTTYDDWSQRRFVQIFTSAHGPDDLRSQPTEGQKSESEVSDRLSTIEEGTEEDDSELSELEALSTYLLHDDKDLQKMLEETKDYFSATMVDVVVEDECSTSQRMPLSYLTAHQLPDYSTPFTDDEETRVPSDSESDDDWWSQHDSNAEDRGMPIYHTEAGSIINCDPIQPDEMMILSFKAAHKGKANKVRTKVVKRDDDLLSPEETKTHWPEIQKAMDKELRTWAKLKCFSRKLRKDARNIIDTRWVLKWKWDQPTVGSGGQSAEPVRVIRARLTIRGFKDVEKNDVARYAGTSSKLSQKLLVSEAATRGWDICTTDISKAFLQGVTYKQLAELTGEPLREVNFYLPASNIPILKGIPGYETFNPQLEVLHCDKPGTGSVDAPRAFSIKLKLTLIDEAKMEASKIDNELLYKHHNGKLIGMMTVHVDDLKITGENWWVKEILQMLEKVFGELKINWNNFTNCGIAHIQDVKSKDITLDQINYAKTLQSIEHPQLTGGRMSEESAADLHQLYQSLLGAVAYLNHTRVDIAVFVCALQRHSSKSTVEHVVKLNKLLRWVQRHPKRLSYKHLTEGQKSEGKVPPTHLRIISDAAFKKETEDGYSLRGVVYLRCPGENNFDARFINCHILEWVCKAQRHVVRSTFAAELLGACDALDQGVLISQMLRESSSGVLSAAQARQLRIHGGFFPVTLHVDAKSVYAAVTATYIKVPAEKSLLTHLQYVREQLDHGILRKLFWMDTRDMIADGLTKGTVSRDCLHEVMDCHLKINHEMEGWSPKKIMSRAAEGQSSDGAPSSEGQMSEPTRDSSYHVEENEVVAAQEYEIFYLDLQEGFAGTALPTRLAEQYGLRAGNPADQDYNWDLSTTEGRRRWKHCIIHSKPLLVVIGFHCTPWTSFQDMANDKAAVMTNREATMPALRLMIWTMRYQAANNRYFLFENPPQSRIWSCPEMQELRALPGLVSDVGQACAYGKLNIAKTMYLWKEHRWIANHPKLIEATCQKCPCTWEHMQHAKCEGPETKASGIYTRQLAVAILKALKYLKSHGSQHFLITTAQAFCCETCPSSSTFTSLEDAAATSASSARQGSVVNSPRRL